MTDPAEQRGWQAAVTAPFESPPKSWGAQRDLRATINLPAIGIAHFGMDGDFLLVSDQFCNMLGYSRADLLSRTFQEITFPAEGPTYVTLTAELAADLIPSYRVEKLIVRLDGSASWLRVTVSAVRQEGGGLGFFLAIAEDISDQKANEQARREAEDRLHAALEASQTGTFRWDIRANQLDWDESLDRLLGWQPGQPARSLEQFVTIVHPEDRARVVEAYWLCAGDGADFDQEFRVVRPDGLVCWLRGRGRTFCDADGTSLYTTGACTDVTEHRRMEDELRVQEAQFRTLANAIPQLAWMTDSSGWIYWYNQRWFEYTGTTLEEVQGWGWQKVHHPDHVKRVVESISRSFATREPWEDTFPLRGKDGRYRWFLSRALPMHDAQNRLVGWFGTNTDITERLEAERAVRDSEARLRRITDSGIIGVFHWTLAGEITDANDEFCRMFGWSRQDVQAGLDWQKLTPPEFREIDRLKEKEVVERGAVALW
ncbi:MAG TPA: PAS domain S-box protein [Longimicrobiales bacterium]|nr:PAS domain S-box protein [Longimicrobiales bacterium]